MKQQFMAVSENGKRLTDVDLQSLNTKYFQYIGVNDRNRKPIYFGSRVAHPQFTGVVAWDELLLTLVVERDLQKVGVTKGVLEDSEVVGHVSDPAQQRPDTFYPKVAMGLLNQLKLTDEIVDIIRSTFCVAGPVVLEMGSEGLRVVNGTGSYKELAIQLAAYLHYPRHSDFKFDRKGCVGWLIDILHTAGGPESIERVKKSKGIGFLRIDGLGVWQVKADGQKMSLYGLCDFILEVIGVQCG